MSGLRALVVGFLMALYITFSTWPGPSVDGVTSEGFLQYVGKVFHVVL